MPTPVEDVYEKAAAYHAKYKDEELNDYLLGLAQRFQDMEAMYHHFSFLLMHIRATVAHTVRPRHLQEAIERAQAFLERYAAQRKA